MMMTLRSVITTCVLCWAVAAMGNDLAELEARLETLKDPEQKLRLLQQSQEASQQWSLEDRGKYLHTLGFAYEAVNDLTQARAQYDQAVALLEHHTPVAEFLIHSLIERSYLTYLESNDPTLYCPDRTRALELARQAGHGEALTRALIHKAFCYQTDRSQFVEALDLLQEALEVSAQHDLGKKFNGMIYNATGIVYRYNQIHEKAYEFMHKAYLAWAERNDVQDMFNMLHNLVSESIQLGRWTHASEHVAEMFSLAKDHPEFGDFKFFAHFNAGRVAHAQNLFTEAAEQLNQALALRDSTNEKYFVSMAEGLLAVAEFRLGQTPQATVHANALLLNENGNANNNDLVLAARALVAYSESAPLDGMQAMFALNDLEKNKRLEFIKYSSLAQASLFEDKLSTFENALLEQALSINNLQLDAEQDKAKIATLTAISVALLALALLAWSVYLRRSRRIYKKLAQTDFLTGVASRRYTFEQGEAMLDAARRQGKPLSVILFDIDFFKSINDRFGHDFGDLAIRQIAENSKAIKRDQAGVLGRIGGEEFLWILPDSDLQKAQRRAEALRQRIENSPMQSTQGQVNMTISAGIACGDAATRGTLDDLVKRADDALYAAKQNGRNLVMAA